MESTTLNKKEAIHITMHAKESNKILNKLEKQFGSMKGKALMSDAEAGKLTANEIIQEFGLE